MSKMIKAYKGTDKEMKCRGHQYEIGTEYEAGGEIRACANGFHACERPLDVLGYYPPATSRYFEVEQSGDLSKNTDDSKVASRKIKFTAEIGIPGLVKAHIEYTKAHTTTAYTDPERATAGDHGAATAGDHGAATAGSYGAATAGDHGAATAGDHGAATAGICGAATAGICGAATAGDNGAATAGDHGAATAGDNGAATAGDHGAATAGICGAATAGDNGAATAGSYGAATAGDHGAATSRGSAAVGKEGIACVRGNSVKVKGGIGAVLVIAVENDRDCGIKEWRAVVVDGEAIKADTWYALRNGELTEVVE